VNNHDAKIFAAQLRDDLPTLDLHGLFPDDAINKVEIFLFDNYNQDEDNVVKIIYGGGTGRLGKQIREYLQEHEMVGEVIKEHGSCLVML